MKFLILRTKPSDIKYLTVPYIQLLFCVIIHYISFPYDLEKWLSLIFNVSINAMTRCSPIPMGSYSVLSFLYAPASLDSKTVIFILLWALLCLCFPLKPLYNSCFKILICQLHYLCHFWVCFYSLIFFLVVGTSFLFLHIWCFLKLNTIQCECHIADVWILLSFESIEFCFDRQLSLFWISWILLRLFKKLCQGRFRVTLC